MELYKGFRLVLWYQDVWKVWAVEVREGKDAASFWRSGYFTEGAALLVGRNLVELELKNRLTTGVLLDTHVQHEYVRNGA